MTPDQLDEIERLAEAETKAEVERLKESVANLDALYVSRTDELRESEAEVERLREVVRQVHALTERGVSDWPAHTAFYALTEIHKIAKGMVNNG